MKGELIKMNRGKCFFVSPIGDIDSPERKQFEIIRNSVKRVCENRDIDLDLISIMDEYANGVITDDILRHLCEDYFCVVNLTGLNANVMYELGIRVQTKKEFVVFADRNTKLPFDRMTDRTLFYDEFSEDIDALNQFEDTLKMAIVETLKKYKPENPLLNKTTDSIESLLPDTRYRQTITFTITDYICPNKKKYLRFRCKHSYELKKVLGEEKIIDIDTFNDISIAEEVNKCLPENDKTQFDCVTVFFDTSDYEEHERTDSKYESEFDFDEYGRPRFATKGINFGDHDKVAFIFDINNIHHLNDKHLWYFEQLSESLTLIIDNKSSFPYHKFTLIVNHPHREEIEQKNQECIKDDGRLKRKYVEIKMDYIFFPYQGFELQWGLEGEGICCAN